MNKSGMINLIQDLINSKNNLVYKYEVSFSKNGDLNLFAIDSSNNDEAKIVFAPKTKLIIAFFNKEENYKFSLEDTYAGETELFNDLILNNVLKIFFAYGSVLVEEIKKGFFDKEKTYLVKVFDGNYGYLFFDENDNEYYTGSISPRGQIDGQKCLFTNSEIDELKSEKDVAIDWDKAELIESQGNDD